MGFAELLLIAIGLSMDAFAVSICKGLSMPRMYWGHAIVIALFFGFFQAAMPVAGWLLGAAFAGFIEPIDHWIAFVLLAVVGAKMIWDAAKEDACEDFGPGSGTLDLRELVMLAIATSIDALAVGISLALLDVNIWFSAATIGITTFVLSLIGVGAGHLFGARFERAAGIIGGSVLILIGLKIVLEHLGILVF